MKKRSVVLLTLFIIVYSLVGYTDSHCPEPSKNKNSSVVKAITSSTRCFGVHHCDPSKSPIEKAVLLKNLGSFEKQKSAPCVYKKAIYFFENLSDDCGSHERSPPQFFSHHSPLFILHSSLLI